MELLDTTDDEEIITVDEVTCRIELLSTLKQITIIEHEFSDILASDVVEEIVVLALTAENARTIRPCSSSTRSPST